MKKHYIKPNIKVTCMTSYHFFAASKENYKYLGGAYGSSSRKMDDFEDDEEEDSMWK